MLIKMLSRGDAFTAPVFIGGEGRSWYGRASWELSDAQVRDIFELAIDESKRLGEADARTRRVRGDAGNPFDPLFLCGGPNLIWRRGYRRGQLACATARLTLPQALTPA